MNTVYVWVNLLTDLRGPRVMSELIRRGFTVTPLSNQGMLSSPNTVGSLLNLSVQMNTVDTPEEFAAGVEEIITGILDNDRILYSMLLVTSPPRIARWNIGNIQRDKAVAQLPKILKPIVSEEKAN